MYVNAWVYLHTQTHARTHNRQLTVSVEPAANKTADHKEPQLCRDRHEDLGGSCRAPRRRTHRFCYLRGTSCRKSEDP